MLVLSRKKQQAVVIGGEDGIHHLLKITVLEIGFGKVKLGFEANADVPVHRLEIWEKMRANGELDGQGASPASGTLDAPSK